MFFLALPYVGNELGYGQGVFEREDFARLVEILVGFKGRSFMSLNVSGASSGEIHTVRSPHEIRPRSYSRQFRVR